MTRMSLFFAAGLLLAQPATALELEDLGRTLFFDVNLSKNRTQACATCHDPEFGFADPRGMTSLGDDGASLGNRNAPTVTYAALTPDFHQRSDGAWAGGQFWDGRANRLEDQAGGPPLNPIEMGMPDKASVVARLKENPEYVGAFEALFADGILEDPEAGYAAMTQAIAAFERLPELSPFDSKYDRYRRGEAQLTREEELGMLLFFSPQFTNCNQCHQLNRGNIVERETFTNHEYHNIGVPENGPMLETTAADTSAPDGGLAANPQIGHGPETGKFRVPTLRNVAVTGPYMHNGIFEDLRTVVLFYNKYNTKSEARRINPETGLAFGAPEAAENISMTELTDGPALDDRRVDALVAFLKTLTDARYEPLLED
ncbi:MAG: cytochrome-c peroxidase [Mangrovicoccus sp.]